MTSSLYYIINNPNQTTNSTLIIWYNNIILYLILYNIEFTIDLVPYNWLFYAMLGSKLLVSDLYLQLSWKLEFNSSFFHAIMYIMVRCPIITTDETVKTISWKLPSRLKRRITLQEYKVNKVHNFEFLLFTKF